MNIHYAMNSYQGDREYNEDTIQMLKLSDREIYVLADGLGGCGHGDVASGVAVRSVINRAKRISFSEENLKQLIVGAQNAVLEKKRMNPELEKMSSTLVILTIQDHMAQWVHIGDSRLYMFRKNKLIHQTMDHSIPQMLVKLGEIELKDIRKHPDRNRLLHSIGYPWTAQDYVLSDRTELQEGDTFLLCTDGFWEYIYEEEMSDLLKKSGSMTEWLNEMEVIVKERGKTENMDNFSAICVQII